MAASKDRSRSPSRDSDRIDIASLQRKAYIDIQIKKKDEFANLLNRRHNVTLAWHRKLFFDHRIYGRVGFDYFQHGFDNAPDIFDLVQQIMLQYHGVYVGISSCCIHRFSGIHTSSDPDDWNCEVIPHHIRFEGMYVLALAAASIIKVAEHELITFCHEQSRVDPNMAKCLNVAKGGYGVTNRSGCMYLYICTDEIDARSGGA